MILVTTHVNTDFDALASMVAAAFLHPGATRLIPSHVQPAVRDFLAVHWDLLRLNHRDTVDLAEVDKLVITDTSSWERLDNIKELTSHADLPVTVWDHHMAGGSIAAAEEHREEVGATVTLLLERFQAQDTAFSPIHATLFLLGIYDDTGSLSFPNTTARDARMAAFLLENGADLNVVSAYLDSSLDERHLDLFSRMLAEPEIIRLNDLRLGVCVQDARKELNMLPTVVSKFMEIQGLDAAFGIFPMGSHKTAVIGRGNPKLFDVGAVVRRLGGGGHPGAGSAVVQAPLDTTRSQVVELIRQTGTRRTNVRDLATPISARLAPAHSLREAAAIMKGPKVPNTSRTERQALPVVDEQGRLLGVLHKAQFRKIKQDRQWEKSVTSMLRQNAPTVHPDQSLREALHLMTHSDLGFLPVVEDGRLVGEITRAAVILNMYEL
ncbi:CBS domain-containing protein [Desulfonatronum thiodismutans]|uniref:CBS domain-containing protein n=1 Tax=Desulfonatronum thiodismutans TaxID=159290 RepID=UPI0004ABEA9E|nr:CBS domain-containing protein [Desulfonatronum thiodismutans]